MLVALHVEVRAYLKDLAGLERNGFSVLILASSDLGALGVQHERAVLVRPLLKRLPQIFHVFRVFLKR